MTRRDYCCCCGEMVGDYDVCCTTCCDSYHSDCEYGYDRNSRLLLFQAKINTYVNPKYTLEELKTLIEDVESYIKDNKNIISQHLDYFNEDEIDYQVKWELNNFKLIINNLKNSLENKSILNFDNHKIIEFLNFLFLDYFEYKCSDCYEEQDNLEDLMNII